MHLERPIIRRVRIRKGTRRSKRIDVHWRSSRLSALSRMCRTAFIVAALVAVVAAGAQASTAKTHQKALSAAGLHAARRAAVSPSVYHTSSASAHSNATHRPTPYEVGRTAGLAIRSRLAPSQVARRRVAIRSTHARTIWTSQPVRRERFIADDYAASPYAANPQSRDSASAPVVSPAVEANGGERAGDDATQSTALSAAPRARTATMTQVPSSVALQQRSAGGQPQRADDLEDNASSPAWRADSNDAAPGEGAVSSSGEMDADSMEGAEQSASRKQTSKAASGATGSEEASLMIPRGVMPKPLIGSLASLERQNDRLEAEGLERIQDEKDLAARIADKLLVPLPASAALVVNEDLEENHRYCRPWTARFLAELAKAHEAAFHRPIQVNSAVRTVEYQKRLMYTNGNAAAAEGDVVSPHLTGSTIDIAKSGLTRDEIAWMRQRLAVLEAAGKIDVEEEFRQSCFHITVYKSYASNRLNVPAQPEKPQSRPRPAEVDTDTAAQGS
jgi:hypothetical protein